MVKNQKTFWNSVFKGKKHSVTVVSACTVQCLCIYALYNMVGIAYAHHYEVLKPRLKLEFGKVSEVQKKVLGPLKEIPPFLPGSRATSRGKA